VDRDRPLVTRERTGDVLGDEQRTGNKAIDILDLRRCPHPLPSATRSAGRNVPRRWFRHGLTVAGAAKMQPEPPSLAITAATFRLALSGVRRPEPLGGFLVWAVLDLYLTHAKNGVRFSQLERQRLARMRYAGDEPQTTDEEVTAA
jgi:hypothetical protein